MTLKPKVPLSIRLSPKILRTGLLGGGEGGGVLSCEPPPPHALSSSKELAATVNADRAGERRREGCGCIGSSSPGIEWSGVLARYCKPITTVHALVDDKLYKKHKNLWVRAESKKATRRWLFAFFLAETESASAKLPAPSPFIMASQLLQFHQ